MAYQIALASFLLAFCTSLMLSSSLVEADQLEQTSENRSLISPNISIPVKSNIDPPTAFPLPVTSHGLYWWVYSSEQIKEYGETFRVLPYVMPHTLPLDPKRIWPRVPLEKICDLEWNETLDKNPHYSPQVREYLKDWYETLVEAFKSPDSQKIMEYFRNEKSFTYIQHPSDVQSVIRERTLLAYKYNSWRRPLVQNSTSQPINPIANNTQLPTRVTNETKTFHDSNVTIPSKDGSQKKSTIDQTPMNKLPENDLLETESTSDACIEDEVEEDPAPSVVSRLLGGTLSGAKEFEARAVNFFYRLAMNAYLANEEKAKDAIKCILGLDCNVPSFIKGMLQEQGFSILVRGTCTPGSCSEETEEIARTFRDQLAATYPELFNATLDLIRDLGSQGTPIKGAGTKVPH